MAVTRVLSAIVVVAALQCFVPVATDCPYAWTSFGDSCYVIIQKSVTWFDAVVACQAVGGSLVEIESSDENNFLHSLMLREHAIRAWIGLFDFLIENVFMWVTNQSEVEYTNWRRGEPNDHYGHGQDCGAILNYGTWDDDSCDAKHWLICERKQSD